MRIRLILPLLLGTAIAQGGLGTHLSNHDLHGLEVLVAVASANDSAVIAARTDLPPALEEILAIDVGATLHGDIYGQVEPAFSLSIRLDPLALIDRERRLREAELHEAEARVRLRVVEAFIRYRVALEQAAATALGLETAREHLRVTEIRYRSGMAIPADVLDARDRAAQAATRLLQANGEIVVALESLAATVGTGPVQVLELMEAGPS